MPCTGIELPTSLGCPNGRPMVKQDALTCHTTGFGTTQMYQGEAFERDEKHYINNKVMLVHLMRSYEVAVVE